MQASNLPEDIYANIYGDDLSIYRGKPALFLDRDGVLVEEVEYLSRIEDIAFIEGSLQSVGRFNQAGVPVFVVTNQSGIGRGYFDLQTFISVQEEIVSRLKSEGAWIDAVVACPHHPEGKGQYRVQHHPFRKPGPGMLLYLEDALEIDLEGSWLVGDKATDIQAAQRAGLKGAVHVETGYGSEQRDAVGESDAPDFKIVRARNLSEATPMLLERLAG